MQLESPVSDLPFVGPAYQKKLAKLEIFNIKDLLDHIPHRYLDFSKTVKIRDARVNEIITISGVVNSFRNQFTKSGKRMQIGSVEDETGKIIVLWFNQPFLIRALYPGAEVSLSGTVSWFAGKPALISPEFEIRKKGIPTTHTGKISGVYPETKGLSSKWIRSRIKMSLSKINLDQLEYLPTKIIQENNLAKLDKAYIDIHFPKKESDYLKAKRRLAFDELLHLHIESLIKRKKWQEKTKSYKIEANDDILKNYRKSLPFALTDSQKKVIAEIKNDLSKSYPMNRLLQGDVGSGKTVVATAAIYMAYKSGYKSLIMAPTQILADQHFKEIERLLKSKSASRGIKISLVTGARNKKIKEDADIFVGTHALINQTKKIKNIAVIVIDEQHKFGVEQRESLLQKKIVPHVLTMTATPIPRTVALTLYGDQELSILDEIPGDRKKVTTWVVPPKKNKGAYEWVKKQIKENKSQVFWICPLIEESEAETMKDIKSVKVEFENLKKVFPKLRLGLLHGRMKDKEKSEVLGDFRSRRIDILVSTPVVEVGIDVPNATIMAIEDSQRFGLAQLHQLRGRVGRGDKKSYCLLFSNHKTPRLEAMTKTHSGFELSELDLKLRGPGEVFGLRQSGFSELKIASWTDAKLIKQTRKVAIEILQKNLLPNFGI